MPKNIVICCDGTGNEIEEAQSNVLKLYRILKRNERQLVYYHPGIGTMGANNGWDSLKQKARGIFGLATGAGLDKNILHAYDFLSRHYEDGDQLYFFGFSRGAYTVRALAGFICAVGLLRPEQLHLASYALNAYKKMRDNNRTQSTRLFEQALKVDYPVIQFMGLWDTVASVLVPKANMLFLPTMKFLAFTKENPLVAKVRHAIAIDERRSMFRPYLWANEGEHWRNPYNDSGAKAQDIKQRWFAGVHSDIGGGMPEAEAGLSKFPLNWMIDEARPGLWTIKATRNQIANGVHRAKSSWDYSKPDAGAKLHNSLTAGWWPLELWPKKIKHREWAKRWNVLGLYVPVGEPRFIAADADIDPSARQRQAECDDYRPANLPPKA